MFKEFIERKIHNHYQKVDRAVYNGSCENPIYLGYDPFNPNRPVYVPCGHCYYCLNVGKQEWIVRNNFEAQMYEDKDKCFITLTLDDNFVNSTNYSDFQRFLKRYRLFLKYHFNKKIRYFGCFERGDKSGRPHFHILIYGDNPQYWSMFKGKDFLYINAWFQKHIWKRGLVKIDRFTGESIGYVVGYVLKKKLRLNEQIKLCNYSRLKINKLNKYSRSDSEAGFKRFEYYFASQGLGFSFFLKKMGKIIAQLKINIGKYTYRIPRFFAKKVKDLFDLDIFCKVRKSLSRASQFFDWLNHANFSGDKFNNDFIFAAIHQYNSDIIDINKQKNYTNICKFNLRC